MREHNALPFELIGLKSMIFFFVIPKFNICNFSLDRATLENAVGFSNHIGHYLLHEYHTSGASSKQKLFHNSLNKLTT